MSRRFTIVAGGAATAALLATAFTIPATATPPADDPSSVPGAAKSDDRGDAAESERRDLRERATELVLSGERTVQDRGGSKAVRIAPGQWAQYGLQSSDNVLTFLVEFGDQKDERFGEAPAGPQHNEIPEPDRSVDNTTYWVEDFSRSHFLDMMFGTDGESFKDLYEEMSSGRYTVDGDVSEWVQVPFLCHLVRCRRD